MNRISTFLSLTIVKGITLAIVAIAAMMLPGPNEVSAQEIYALRPESCTQPNCASLTLPGTVLSVTTSASTWVGKLFAGANECLRLDVDRQNADLRMVVLAPNGTTYQNDDRAANDLRPLVQVNPTTKNGWYTVQLSKFNGEPVTANFTLLYGRYVANNPNCAQAPAQPAGQGPGGFQIQVVPGVEGGDTTQNKTDTPAAAPAAGEPAAQ